MVYGQLAAEASELAILPMPKVAQANSLSDFNGVVNSTTREPDEESRDQFFESDKGFDELENLEL